VTISDKQDEESYRDIKSLANPADFNAMFTLSLAAQHNLSQTAIDSVIMSSNILVQSHVNHCKQQIKSKLMELQINSDFLDNISVETCLRKEWHKAPHARSSTHVKTLLKATHADRVSMLAGTSQGCMARVFEKYPCFKECVYVSCLLSLFHQSENTTSSVSRLC